MYLRFFSTVVFVLRTRRAPVNGISCYFSDQGPAKRRLFPLIADSRTLFFFLCVWRVHVELRKNNSCHSQLSYKLERNIVKLLTLAGKQTERITQKKLSTIYHVILSIFSLFHFYASMKPLASIRWYVCVTCFSCLSLTLLK